MSSAERTAPPYPSPPTVPLKACPIATSLRVLGRKWTLTILREVAFFPQARFAQIRRANPGLLPRTLSLRLRELASEDLVQKVTPTEDPRHPYYELTTKGLEVWPILSALFQFGIHNHAPTVFEDGRARNLEEVYPQDAALLLGPLTGFARTAASPAGGRAVAGPAASNERLRPSGR